MASETCTTLVIHPDFKPNSPLESHFETSSSDHFESTEHSTSDARISVLED